MHSVVLATRPIQSVACFDFHARAASLVAIGSRKSDVRHAMIDCSALRHAQLGHARSNTATGSSRSRPLCHHQHCHGRPHHHQHHCLRCHQHCCHRRPRCNHRHHCLRCQQRQFATTTSTTHHSQWMKAGICSRLRQLLWLTARLLVTEETTARALLTVEGISNSLEALAISRTKS